MTKEEFDARARRHRYFRIAGLLSKSRLAIAGVCVAISSVIVALFDGTLSVLTAVPNLVIVLGIFMMLGLTEWAVCELAETIEAITSVFTDESVFASVINEMLGKFPKTWYGLLLGIPISVLLVLVQWGPYPIATRVYIIIVGVVGGELFGIGFFAYLWSYQLMWRLRHEDADAFRLHRLRHLSSYACTLSAIGILPTLMTWLLFFHRSLPLQWFVLAEALIVITAFVIAESAISMLASRARRVMYDQIAELMKRLWVVLRRDLGEEPDCIDRKKRIVDLIDRLDVMQRMIAGWRVKLIAWDSFCGKVLLPIVLSIVAVAAKLAMDV